MGCSALWGGEIGLAPGQVRERLTQWFEVSVGRSEGECRTLIRKGLLGFKEGS